MKNKQNYLFKVLSSFLVLVLLTFTVLPSVNSAATIEVNLEQQVNNNLGVKIGDIITEEKINDIASTDTLKVILKLNGNQWASDIATKKQLVIDSMVTEEKSELQKIFNSTGVNLTSPDTLELTLTKDTSYNIKKNQTITMNLPATLIENWEGQVTPVSFTIYAKPEVTVGGSILNATKDDLIKGGKTIDLNLLNAKWNITNTGGMITITGLNKILDQFKINPTTQWAATQYLKSIDPNTFVSFANENRTLRMTLPPIPANKVDTGAITFDSVDGGTTPPTSNISSTYIIDTVIGSPLLYESADENASKSFTIGASTGLTISNTSESAIVGGTSNITLTLTDGSWATPLDPEKKKVLIDALVATKQKEQWKKVQDALKTSANLNAISVTANIITIPIPTVSGYTLTEDQVITLNVPNQLLSTSADVTQSFKITATSKAIVSGSVAPEVSQTDLAKGGKTIVVTLVNAKWENEIASNTAKREQLLNGLNFGTLDATIQSVINAKAEVIRSNDNVVTVKLPPIDGVKVNADVNVTFSIGNTPAQLTDIAVTTSSEPVFKIAQVTNQTVSLSGTILEATEFDIVAGGKTIILTLKNDTWINNTALLQSTLATNLASITSSVTVTRNSDTVVTIQLNGNSSYQLLSGNQTFTLSIPDTLFVVSSGNKSVSFDILDVSAKNIGNSKDGLDAAELSKGGKTIVVSLENATFKDNLTKSQLLSVIQNGSSALSTAVYSAINSSSDSKILSAKGNKLTIKLPSVSYVGSGSINLEVPSGIINNGKRNIPVSSVNVGAISSVASDVYTLTESQIKNGTSFTLTLYSGAEWNPTITSNKSIQNALLKGFAVNDQENEWKTITDKIVENNNFRLSNSNRSLTITIPSIKEFTIVRDQEISVKISKSVLTNYKYDIELNQKLKIAVPTISNNKSFQDVLQDLSNFIATNNLEKIRVKVPEKKLEELQVTNVSVPNSGNITTVKIKTNGTVNSGTLSVSIGEANQSKLIAVGNNSYTFVFTNVDAKSDVKVSLTSNNKVEEVFGKAGNGKKTYSLLPKKEIDGLYSLSDILTDDKLLKEIFKYYSPSELEVGTTN
ncbi:hypothetical protein [Lysinibacillus antri]|uniref:Uncharacterized protein n=1 Tax=Lysinibacillus antri TaxID=2498145 RepID=A0A432L931_9BACI|nr:hypothetical protein [Lysinibacillus antri]RUL49813.1 hypothetical protein EK386_14755 [Lysinibacillus antri]